MFTKITVALAIALGTITGAMAATKTPPKAQQNSGYTCSGDGMYCGNAAYWEGFRDMGNRD
jgi:hypothetical protein